MMSIIHSKQLLQMLAAVAQTGHLVLPAQFASRLHPLLEKSAAGLYNIKMLKSDVLISLSLRVAIHLLAVLV